MKLERDLVVAARPVGYGVEFFGLPGSGKTTVARELHARLSRERDVVFGAALLSDEKALSQRALAKAGLIAKEFLTGRVGALTIARAFGTDQPSLRDRVRAASTVATVLSLDSRLRRDRVEAIMDQGILQSIWTIRLMSRSRAPDSLVEDLLDAAMASGRVQVTVETPPSVCAARLGDRQSKHSRLQSPQSAAADVWYRAEEVRREVLEDFRATCMKNNVAPPVFVVDGSEDAGTSVARIVARLSGDSGSIAAGRVTLAGGEESY